MKGCTGDGECVGHRGCEIARGKRFDACELDVERTELLNQVLELCDARLRPLFVDFQLHEIFVYVCQLGERLKDPRLHTLKILFGE